MGKVQDLINEIPDFEVHGLEYLDRLSAMFLSWAGNPNEETTKEILDFVKRILDNKKKVTYAKSINAIPDTLFLTNLWLSYGLEKALAWALTIEKMNEEDYSAPLCACCGQLYLNWADKK